MADLRERIMVAIRESLTFSSFDEDEAWTDIEPLIREAQAEALEEAATNLPAETEGVAREGTAHWKDQDKRNTYSLAIEEAQGALTQRAAAYRVGEGEQ